ncbi:MAG: hypothetical protein F6J86_05390 [Symploca sp. SIO1B1]|nr:hypothetical protein [Symploca sp. SIO1B1]
MKPVDLTKWTVETYTKKDLHAEKYLSKNPSRGLQEKPNWQILPDGKSVQQSVQSLPTFFYSNFNALGHTISLTVNAEDSSINNFIGFALNFQPGDAEEDKADADFLLLNWMARSDHQPGLKLSQMKGPVSYLSFFRLPEVVKAKTLSSAKWEHERDYHFKIVFTKSKLQIWVDNSLEFDLDGNFEDGRFSLFDCAQDLIDFKDIQADLQEDVPPSWEKLTYHQLQPSDLHYYNGFGSSVAISGKTAIIGSSNKEAPGGKTGAGAAYIYQREGGTWTKKAGPLQPSDLKSNDHFGYAVGISEKTAIVGAALGDANQTDAGSAYIYQLEGGIWQEKPALQHSDGKNGDKFGFSVAISGDIAIVGAPGVDAQGKPDMGAAYIYQLQGGTWQQQGSPLRPSDGNKEDYFGWSVAISGDIAIIGANQAKVSGQDNTGAAYIFQREGGIWTQKQKLIPSDLKGRDSFGCSVAISGKVAIVGAVQASAPGDNKNGGAAYIFQLEGETWQQQGGLLQSPHINKYDSYFGWSVAISGKTAIVGSQLRTAPRDKANTGAAYILQSKANAGAAYIFQLEGGTWQLLKKPTQPLQPPQLQDNDFLGYAVALSEGVAIVGAMGAKIANSSGPQPVGAVYVFEAGT